MTLSTWIEKNGGSLKTGNLLGVKANAVYAWKSGVCIPRPATMQLIVRKSAGRVSYADIVEGHLKVAGKAPSKTSKKTSKKTAKKKSVKKAPAKAVKTA